MSETTVVSLMRRLVRLPRHTRNVWRLPAACRTALIRLRPSSKHPLAALGPVRGRETQESAWRLQAPTLPLPVSSAASSAQPSPEAAPPALGAFPRSRKYD